MTPHEEAEQLRRELAEAMSPQREGEMPKLEDVASVYEGEAGACCCGCSGTHTYASKHRETAGKMRGHAIGDDEVDDAEVERVYDLVANAPKEEREFLGGCVVWTHGSEVCIVYEAS